MAGCDVMMHERSGRHQLEVRRMPGCSTRASARWPVSASACSVGNRGVRSPGSKPKWPLVHPGATGEEKTGGKIVRLPGPGAAAGCPGVMGERE